MPDPLDRPVVKPSEDDQADPPVPAGEPSRTEEEASREDLAIRGAAAGGALGGTAGYTGGAAAGTGGAVGMRQVQADEAAEAAADEGLHGADPVDRDNMGQADA